MIEEYFLDVACLAVTVDGQYFWKERRMSDAAIKERNIIFIFHLKEIFDKNASDKMRAAEDENFLP